MNRCKIVLHKKALWHSRRGMLELESLLIPFAESVFSDLNENEQHAYMGLLACEDPDIYAWLLTNVTPTCAELSHIVVKILQFHNLK